LTTISAFSDGWVEAKAQIEILDPVCTLS
jgi:hypothetical protein